MAQGLSRARPTCRGRALVSRLRDEMNKPGRGRSPLEGNLAVIRCASVTSLEWSVERSTPPSEAEAVVIKKFKEHQRFVRKHGRVTRSNIEVWRHQWAPEQSAESRAKRRNPAVWAPASIMQTVRDGLTSRMTRRLKH